MAYASELGMDVRLLWLHRFVLWIQKRAGPRRARSGGDPGGDRAPGAGGGGRVGRSLRRRRRRIIAPAFRLYEEGPRVKQRLVVRGHPPLAVWVEQRSCLYGLLGGRIRRNRNVRSGRMSKKGGQAARRKAAPRGANFWLRVSMCQIAWASRRAMSTWATFAPRCLPSLFLVRW
jgi:hypothetical protein